MDNSRNYNNDQVLKCPSCGDSTLKYIIGSRNNRYGYGSQQESCYHCSNCGDYTTTPDVSEAEKSSLSLPSGLAKKLWDMDPDEIGGEV